MSDWKKPYDALYPALATFRQAVLSGDPKREAEAKAELLVRIEAYATAFGQGSEPCAKCRGMVRVDGTLGYSPVSRRAFVLCRSCGGAS